MYRVHGDEMREPQDTAGHGNINGHELEETILREDKDDGLVTSLHYQRLTTRR
jgi:hypothetical protein